MDTKFWEKNANFLIVYYFATVVSSDFLSTEKELDTLICYLYGLEVIQD